MGVLRRIFAKIFRKPGFSAKETNLMRELAKDPKFTIPPTTTDKEKQTLGKYYGEGMTKTGSGERPVERMQRELREKRETAELRRKLIQSGLTPGQADKEIRKRK